MGLARNAAGPSVLTSPEGVERGHWQGPDAPRVGCPRVVGEWGRKETQEAGAFGTMPHSQLILNLHFQSTFLCLSSSSLLSREFGGVGTRVTEDGGSERLSDFPRSHSYRTRP